MKKLRGVRVLAVAGILAGICNQGWAASSALLSDLDTGVGSISAGNAVYSNFGYGGTTLDSTVVATASVDGSGNAVITFTRTSGDWTEFDGNSVVTFHAAFTVPVTSTVLDFVASASGLSMASVGETINDGTGHPLQVFTGFLGTQLTDSYTFGSPVLTLDTVKSIDIAANNNLAVSEISPGEIAIGPAVTITSVDNVFVSTPEPASLGVLGMGVLGLMLRRRAR
jgi:hypothetical protein